jgi:hypothetical protein
MKAICGMSYKIQLTQIMSEGKLIPWKKKENA